MINNPYQSYSTTQAMTATPGELTLMLYNGAIRFLKQANSAIEHKQIEQANKNILSAQNIVLELMSTLKMEYDVSHNLMALYDFIHRHLMEANVQKDAKKVTDVIVLLEDLRNTWSEAMKLSRGQHAVGTV